MPKDKAAFGAHDIYPDYLGAFIKASLGQDGATFRPSDRYQLEQLAAATLGVYDVRRGHPPAPVQEVVSRVQELLNEPRPA